MNEILVFDPAQCCATGVCGSEVDTALVRFAADLEWLSAQGVPVRRFNLAHDGAAFAQHALVRRTLQQEGAGCLPLVLLGGEILSRGRYPVRTELATWGGATPAGTLSPEGPERTGAPGPANDPAVACCTPPVVGLGTDPAAGRGSSGCC
jgi:hypothetical protein